MFLEIVLAIQCMSTKSTVNEKTTQQLQKLFFIRPEDPSIFTKNSCYLQGQIKQIEFSKN